MARRRERFITITAWALCVVVVVPYPSHAETQVFTTDATYTMGEGETMTFAESMALQKAKQIALEQAGTYVESYTKVQNYKLTAEEIQTLAGGLMQVEIMEKTKTLVGDGLKFFVKIKVTITTDKADDLARRLKDKNIAAEYRTIQESYAQLEKEIASIKQRLAQSPSAPERSEALNSLSERQKTFWSNQVSEAALVDKWALRVPDCSKSGGYMSRSQADQLVGIVEQEGWSVLSFHESGNSGKWSFTMKHPRYGVLCVEDRIDYERKKVGLGFRSKDRPMGPMPSEP